MLLTQLVALNIINMAKSEMCIICIIKKAFSLNMEPPKAALKRLAHSTF